MPISIVSFQCLELSLVPSRNRHQIDTKTWQCLVSEKPTIRQEGSDRCRFMRVNSIDGIGWREPRRLGFQVHLAQECCESRVGAQRVETWSNP
jgi:hypothetical protein